MKGVKIYCIATSKGVHSFFLTSDGQEYYLFSQNYRKGVQEYFGRGVRLEDARKFSKCNHDNALIRTMEKLPTYIRYLESEYGLEILDKTARKNRASLAKCA